MFDRLAWQRAWQLTTATLLGCWLIGCTQQAASPTTGGAEPAAGAKAGESKAAPADVQLETPETIPPATPAPATAPAAQATARPEPKGQIVYAVEVQVAPAWFDPQENPQLITPYVYQYLLHDAVVKHLPGQPFAPSLAESYEIAPDFKSATFKLRSGIKFHSGDPVTPEDVKFSFEKYRGANAKLLKDKTERIEVVDDRTVKFVFKEPFLDFQVLYGSPASGAAWVVPKQYYEQVGPDGFKQTPIGAGPYKLIRQTGGAEFEFEAVTDYWRRTPNVKTIIIRVMTEDATRLAALQNGEADLIGLVPGPLVDVVRANPQLQLAATRSSSIWLEFPGFERPENPFHNSKVRQAVSFALDRKAMSQAEQAGLSAFEGNWIPENWPGAIQRPAPEYDLAKAKQLMSEAGFPNGFETENLTPLPPYYSFGERIITALREIGIRAKLNQMERGAFFQKLTEGPDAFKGIILQYSASPGDAAARIRSYALCKGATSRTCVPEIDERMARYDASADPQEREQLIREVQEYILDTSIFVPMFRSTYLSALGPRIANYWEEVTGVIPQYVTFGPYEDIRLKE